MSEPLIPAVYRGPFGAPLYWGDETTGALKAAVLGFLRVENAGNGYDFELLKAYLVHHIDAPIWLEKNAARPLAPELAERVLELRRTARQIRNSTDAWAYLAGCLEIGLDPL